MKISTHLAGVIGVTALVGFAACAQAGIIIQPSIVIGQPAVVVQPPVVVAPAIEFVPGPFDLYITNAAPADVVFFRGDTFIWTVDAYGHRVQRFYAHGDHRQDVFRRRDELHRVMARNGGRLPDHAMHGDAGHRAAEQHHEDHRDDHHDDHR